MNVLSAAQVGEPDKCIQQIHNMQAECRHAIERSQDVSKQAYERWKGENPSFHVGLSVWLEVMNLSTDEPPPKLASKCHGPFKIMDKLSDLTVMGLGFLGVSDRGH
jgi:hypothetical protein